jgi:hypothetical protein
MIGWFMICMGLALAVVIIELIRKNNERHK